MSESLLRGLVQLFAIIAKLDGVQPSERKVVENFLGNQLNLATTVRYMIIFDEFANKKPKKKITFEEDHSWQGERASVRDSSKLLLICTQINQEMTQHQKVDVLITLFKLVWSDKTITEQEYEFITTAADTFNIPQNEFFAIEKFILNEDHTTLLLDDLLVMDGGANLDFQESTTVYYPSLEGRVSILRLPSVDRFLFRYNGEAIYYLNNTPVVASEVQLLAPGTSLRGPKLRTIYYSDLTGSFLRTQRAPSVTFEAREVYYTFTNGRTGLVDFNMFETSGRLIGLMGASGTGKSTLLEVLNGNATPNSGRVLINGYDVHHQPEEIQGAIGYVPQDDLLIEQLTVWENLYYAAKLSFGQEPLERIRQLVERVLNDLGLSEIRDLKVGSPLNKTISGGQRKRLNIGLELLREPSVLFVDEPTSGLSSRDSLNIMELLKELATKGKLVFVVIHQPSSDIFKMFDRLHILDQGGYPIYYGDPVEALIYFKEQADQIDKDEAECIRCGNVKTEQIFDIIEARIKDEYGRVMDERKVTPLDWYQKFKETRSLPRLNHLREKVPVSTKIASAWEQLGIFFERDIKAKLSNVQYLAIVLMEAPLLAIVLAYICKYYTGGEYIFSENDNIPVFIFVSIIVAIFMGLTVSAEEIFRDRKILKRESFLNLSWGSYLLSKMAILAIISALQTLAFLAIGHAILDFHGMFWVHFVVLFSIGVFSHVLGLNISSAFNSAVTIYILIPILLIPQLVLGGIVVRFDNLHPNLRPEDGVPLVADIMVSRWGYEALMVSQFKRNRFHEPFFELDQRANNAYYKKSFLIPALANEITLMSEALRDDVRLDTAGYQQSWRRVLHALNQERELAEVAWPLDTLTPIWHALPAHQWEPLQAYVEDLRKYYVRVNNSTTRAKDNLVASLTRSTEETERFLRLRENYTNEALTTMVENTTGEARMVEAKDRYVQKLFPIYKAPQTNRNTKFSTHFFAPYKPIFGYPVSTLTANLIMIWLFTLFLFWLLYANILRNLVTFRYQDVVATVARRQARVWGRRLAGEGFKKKTSKKE